MNSIPKSLITFLEKNKCCKIKYNYIVTRCPYCGDSRKHPTNHGHLYLYLDSGFAKCFRCGKFVPIIDALYKIAESIHVNLDNTIVQFCQQISKRRFLMSFTKYTKSFKPLTAQQIEYLKHRIPHIPESKYEDLNIVNPEEYFGSDYIGFKTYLGTKLIARAIKENIPRYRIKKFEQAIDFYMYDVDKFLLYRRVIIGEGIFDILSSFAYNTNALKIASLGLASLYTAIKFVYVYFGFKYQLIMLIDSDVSLRYIKSVLRYSRNMLLNAKVYKNVLGKDFGEILIQPKLVYEI